MAQNKRGTGVDYHLVQEKSIYNWYNALGQSTQTNRFENLTGSGTELQSLYGYDTTNRLTSLSHRNGSSTILSNYAYQYDNMNRITQVNHTAALPAHAEGISNFVYDKSSQLTSADNVLLSKPDENFQYDANGNRTGTSTGGAYVNGTNNLTSEDATYTYIYDQEGNRIQRTKKSDGSYEQFIWDNRNRLTQVVKKNSSGTTQSYVQYAYDTLNRMVKRREVTGATIRDNFFAGFDGINATLEFEKVGNGSNATSNDLKHRYLWGDRADQLLADEQYSGAATPATSVGNTLWALTDHLGTIRDVADFSGSSFSVVEHRTYDSFGKRTDQPGSTGLISFGYTGKYHDSYTNTTYHWNRWYDPQLGKWISEDPIGFAGGDLNLNRYVGNRTLSAIDPTGFVVILVHGINNFNRDEINEITKLMNEHWDSLGVPRQEIIHFTYGTGTPLQPLGPSAAWYGTSDYDNIYAGSELSSLLTELRVKKEIIDSNEPITVIAYSNGTNLAYEAARGSNSPDIDRLLLLGGSLNRDNDMHLLPTRYQTVVNFTSKRDQITWYVNGIGNMGMHERDIDHPNIFEIRVPQVYHSLNEIQSNMNETVIGEKWKKPKMLQGYDYSLFSGYSLVEGTFWLSPKMWKDYYRHYMAESGDGRLSRELGTAYDDKPRVHEFQIPQ